ncbi:golgin subfamily B member 1-like isoform X2, partial [Argonauta hians]
TTKATLSKTKLQAKAKIAKLTNQLEEAKKCAQPDSSSDRGSECGDETVAEQASRGKIRLLRHKLASKEQVLAEKEEEIVAKDRSLAERDQSIGQLKEIINTLNGQLADHDRIMKDLSKQEDQSIKSQDAMDQIYTQILSKDKKIIDLNNSIIELDNRMKDLQEFIGEKNEVIKGRDKVIGVLQTSIVEKEQNISSQNALIAKLTNKVETEEEKMSLLQEDLEKAEHSLKVETERFNLRLSETQKYFEETLTDREGEISQLRGLIRDREKELTTRDKDLRELLARHERDIEKIMSKEGGGSMHDQMLAMMEQKVKDVNEVLQGKIQVVEIQARELTGKDQQLQGVMDHLKTLKEKLAVSTEQNLLMQQSFADFEAQWRTEKLKMETRFKTLAEKSEEEKGEMNLQLHSLQMSLKQYESAYSQAALHYNALQERYQLVCSEINDLKNSSAPKDGSNTNTTTNTNTDTITNTTSNTTTSDTTTSTSDTNTSGNDTTANTNTSDTNTSGNDNTETAVASENIKDLAVQLEAETAQKKQLEEQLLQQRCELDDARAQLHSLQQQKQDRPAKCEEADSQGSKSRERHKMDSSPAKVSDSRMLKIKAQFTAKIKSLEKEIEQLKKGQPSSNEVEDLKNRLAEAEEDKGNLLLQLVDFDDVKALQDELRMRLSEVERHNDGLRSHIHMLEATLKDADQEVLYLRERAAKLEMEQNINPFADGEVVVAHSDEDKLLLSELQQKCSEQSDSLLQANAHVVQLEADLLDSRIEIEGLKAQIHASDAGVEQLQKHLVDSSERVTQLEEGRHALEQERYTLQQQVNDLQHKVTEYKKLQSGDVAVTEGRERGEEEEEEKAQLKMKVQELQAELTQQQDVSKKDKEYINELISKLQSMELDRQLSSANVDTVIGNMTRAKIETDEELKRTQVSLEESQTKLQQTEQALHTAHSQHQHAQRELQQSANEAFTNLQHQSTEIGRICHFLDITEISVEQLFHVVKRKVETVTELQRKVEEFEKSLREQQDALQSKEIELGTLKSQAENYEKNVQHSIRDLAAESQSYKENLSEKDENIKLLQETINSQTCEISKLQETQRSKDQVLASLEHTVEKYETEASEKQKEFSSQTASFQERIASLQDDVEDKQKALSEAESKVSLLEKTLQEKVEELTKFVSERSKMNEDSAKTLAEKQALIDNLTSSVENMTGMLNDKQFEFESKLNEMNCVVSQLNADKTEKDAKIESLLSKVSELTSHCNETDVSYEKVLAVNSAQEKTLQNSGEILKDLLVNRLGISSTHDGPEKELPLPESISIVISQMESLLSEKIRLESMLEHSEKNNVLLKSSVEELENKCSKNELTLMNLQSDSSEQELAVKKLMEEKDLKISYLQENSESLNAVLQQSQLEANDMRQQMKNMQDSSHFLQQQLTDATNEVQLLTQQQTQLQEQLKLVKEQEISWETSRQEVEHSLKEEAEKVRLLSENLELVLHEKECMRAELENGIHEVQLATNTNLQLTRDVGQLQHSLSEKESLLGSLSKELEKEKSHLSLHLEECRSLTDHLKQALDDSNSKLAQVSSINVSFEKSIAEHREQLLQLEEEKDQLLSKLCEYDDKTLQSSLDEKDRASMENRLATSERLVAEKDSTIEQLRVSLNDAENKVSKNSAVLQEMLLERKDLEEKLAEFNLKIKREQMFKEPGMNAESMHQHMTESLDSCTENKGRELHGETKTNQDADEEADGDVSLMSRLWSLQSSVSQQLSQRNACIVCLEEQLETSLNNESKLVKEIQLLQSEKHDSEMDVVNFKVSLQEKEDLLRNLLLSLDESKQYDDSNKEKLETLLNDNQFYQQTIRDLQTELKERTELSVSSEECLDKMKSSLREGEIAAASFRRSHESLQHEYDIICQKLKETEYNLDEKNLEVSRIQGVLRNSQQSLEQSFEKVKKESEMTINDLVSRNQKLTAELDQLRSHADPGGKAQAVVDSLKRELADRSHDCTRLKARISANDQHWSEANQLIDACLLDNNGTRTSQEPFSKTFQPEKDSKNGKKQNSDSTADVSQRKKVSKKSPKRSKNAARSNSNSSKTGDSWQNSKESNNSSTEECMEKVLLKKLKHLVDERQEISKSLESIKTIFAKDSLQEESPALRINELYKLCQEQASIVERLQLAEQDRELTLQLAEQDREMTLGQISQQLSQVYDKCSSILPNNNNAESRLATTSQDSEFSAASDDRSKNIELQTEALVRKFSKLFEVVETWKDTHRRDSAQRPRQLGEDCAQDKNSIQVQDEVMAPLLMEAERVQQTGASRPQVKADQDPNCVSQPQQLNPGQNAATVHNTILNIFGKFQNKGISVNLPAMDNPSEDILEVSLYTLFNTIVSVLKDTHNLQAFIQTLEEESHPEKVLELIKRKKDFITDSTLAKSEFKDDNSLCEFDEDNVQLERNVNRLRKDREELENRLILVSKENENLKSQLSKTNDVELLRITIGNLEEDLKKRLMEKDLVAEQLAKVDLDLVSTSRERDKVKNHLEQVMRDHKKCFDTESRLERDKQVLSQKLMDMDSKMSRMTLEKERMKKQLALTKPKTDKTGPLRRRTRSQEANDRKLSKNQEDSKRKSSLIKKGSDKCHSRYGSVESVQSEIVRVSSPTLSEKSFGTSDSCVSEISLLEELIELRAKTEAYSKHFEDLKLFWRNDICKALSEMFPAEAGDDRLARGEETGEKPTETVEVIAARTVNLKLEMTEILAKIENWKTCLSSVETSEKDPSTETDLDDNVVEGKHLEGLESESKQQLRDLQTENERLKLVCVKLKKCRVQSNAKIEELKKELENVDANCTLLLTQQQQCAAEQLKAEEIKGKDFELLVTELRDSLDVKTAEVGELQLAAQSQHLSLTNEISRLETSLSANLEELGTTRNYDRILKESFSLLVKNISEIFALSQFQQPEMDPLKNQLKQFHKELDSGSFPSLDEFKEKCFKASETLKMLTIFLGQNQQHQQSVTTVVASFMYGLKEIQNDIHKEAAGQEVKSKDAVLEDLSKIINSKNYTEQLTCTEYQQHDLAKLKSEMCPLEDSNSLSGLNFLNWLRRYLHDVTLSHSADHAMFLDIISELNVVVVSKEESIQAMSETIEMMSAERKKLINEVARLQNAYEDSQNCALTESEESRRVKNSLDALENRISGLLTYVKNVHGSTLETIMEEAEDEEDDEDGVAREAEEDGAADEANVDNLQSLEKHFSAFAAAYCRITDVCNSQGSELQELRALLTQQQQQQQQQNQGLSAECPSEITASDVSAESSDRNTGPSHPHQDIDPTQHELHQTAALMSVEVGRITEELAQVKEEKEEGDKQLAAAERHREELETKVAELGATNENMQSNMQALQLELQQNASTLASLEETCKSKELQMQELHLEVSEKSTEIDRLSVQLREAEDKVESVNQCLRDRESDMEQLQDLLVQSKLQQSRVAEEEVMQEMSLLKEQISVREQQLQNLTLQISDNMRASEETEGKLRQKDEKIMSLVENMQELEEQLTDSLSTKEACEAKVAELEGALEKERESVDSTKKLLHSKENQYLKVLATAKKLKLQYTEAKKEMAAAAAAGGGAGGGGAGGGEGENVKESHGKLIEDINTMNSMFEQRLSTTLAEWPQLAEREGGRDPAGADISDSATEGSGSLTAEPCKTTYSLLHALTSRLDAAKQVLAAHQQENAKLKQLSNEQEVLLSEFNQRQEVLLSQNLEKEDLLAAIEEKDNRMAELQGKVFQLEKQSVTETEKDFRISFLSEQLDESGHKILRLQEEITDKNQILEDNKVNTTRLEEKLQELSDQEQVQLKEMALQMQALSAQFNEKDANIEELSSLLKTSEEKMSSISTELCEKETVIAELTNMLDTVSKQNQVGAEEMKNLKEIYNQTVEELQITKEDINSKNSLLEQIGSQLETVSNEVKDKERIIATYKEQLEQFYSDKEKERESVPVDTDSDLKTSYEELQSEYHQVCLDKERLSAECKKTVNENNRLNEELKESLFNRNTLEDSLNISQETIGKMKEDLEKYTEDLSQACKEKLILSDSVEKLKMENATLLEKCNAQSSEILPEEVLLVKQQQASLYTAHIEKDTMQRSEAKSSPESQPETPSSGNELQAVQQRFDSLFQEHAALKKKQQLTAEKCDKLLVKLKLFKDKNTNLLKEINKLKEEKARKETRVSELERDLEYEHVKYKELKASYQQQEIHQKENSVQLTEYDNKYKEIVQVNEALSKSNSELHAKCDKLSKHIEDVATDKTSFEDMSIRLKQELETVSSQYTVERSTLLNKISNLEGECQNVYADLEDFQQLVKKQKDTQDNLKSENHKLKESVSKLEKDLLNSSAAENHCSQIEIQLQGLSEERDNLKDQVDVAREEIGNYRKEVAVLRKRCEEDKEKLQKQEILVAELLAEKSRMESIEKEASVEKDLEDRLHSLEVELQTKVREAELVRSENQTLSQQIRKEEKEKEAYRKEVGGVGSMEQLLRQSQEHGRQLEQQLTELRSREGELEQELRVSRTQESELQQELRVSRTQESELQQELRVSRTQELELQQELRVSRTQEGELQQELRVSRTQEGELEQEKMYLEEQLQAVKMELEANKEMMRQNLREIEELHNEATKLSQQNKNGEDLRKQLEACRVETGEKEAKLSQLLTEANLMNDEIERLTSENLNLEGSCQEGRELRKENTRLAKELEHMSTQNEELLASRTELGVVSERYNQLLSDNTQLAKQFEEVRNKMQAQMEKEQTFAHEQQEHLKREQVTLAKRVEDLEKVVEELTGANTRLKQEMVQVGSSLKEAQFEANSLQSQLQVIQHSGDRMHQFQEEYQKLQVQFSQCVEQNNSVEAELNQANHRLQLRESRCQQLAMQVSQLAEDRSYLNVQMGNLSLALREKEKESASLTLQVKGSYEKHTQLQQRITELESSHNDALHKPESPNSSETEGQLLARISELEDQLEEVMSASVEESKRFVAERNQRIQVEILLQQSQKQLHSLREQLQPEFQLEMGEESDRIVEVEPLLVRQGSNHCNRLLRWMKVKKEYFCFSSRHMQRLLRFRPNLRIVIWLYFALLHIAVIVSFATLL